MFGFRESKHRGGAEGEKRGGRSGRDHAVKANGFDDEELEIDEINRSEKAGNNEKSGQNQKPFFFCVKISDG